MALGGRSLRSVGQTVNSQSATREVSPTPVSSKSYSFEKKDYSAKVYELCSEANNRDTALVSSNQRETDVVEDVDSVGVVNHQEEGPSDSNSTGAISSGMSGRLLLIFLFGILLLAGSYQCLPNSRAPSFLDELGQFFHSVRFNSTISCEKCSSNTTGHDVDIPRTCRAFCGAHLSNSTSTDNVPRANLPDTTLALVVTVTTVYLLAVKNSLSFDRTSRANSGGRLVQFHAMDLTKVLSLSAVISILLMLQVGRAQAQPYNDKAHITRYGFCGYDDMPTEDQCFEPTLIELICPVKGVKDEKNLLLEGFDSLTAVVPFRLNRKSVRSSWIVTVEEITSSFRYLQFETHFELLEKRFSLPPVKLGPASSLAVSLMLLMMSPFNPTLVFLFCCLRNRVTSSSTWKEVISPHISVLKVWLMNSFVSCKDYVTLSLHMVMSYIHRTAIYAYSRIKSRVDVAQMALQGRASRKLRDFNSWAATNLSCVPSYEDRLQYGFNVPRLFFPLFLFFLMTSQLLFVSYISYLGVASLGNSMMVHVSVLFLFTQWDIVKTLAVRLVSAHAVGTLWREGLQSEDTNARCFHVASSRNLVSSDAVERNTLQGTDERSRLSMTTSPNVLSPPSPPSDMPVTHCEDSDNLSLTYPTSESEEFLSPYEPAAAVKQNSLLPSHQNGLVLSSSPFPFVSGGSSCPYDSWFTCDSGSPPVSKSAHGTVDGEPLSTSSTSPHAASGTEEFNLMASPAVTCSSQASLPGARSEEEGSSPLMQPVQESLGDCGPGNAIVVVTTGAQLSAPRTTSRETEGKLVISARGISARGDVEDLPVLPTNDDDENGNRRIIESFCSSWTDGQDHGLYVPVNRANCRSFGGLCAYDDGPRHVQDIHAFSDLNEPPT